MRSFIMGLLVAIGLAFLFVQSTTLRVHMVEERPRISFREDAKQGRVSSTTRIVKRGTNEGSFREMRIVGRSANKELAFEDAYLKAIEALQDKYNLRTELSPEDLKTLIRDTPTESMIPMGNDPKTGKPLDDAVQVEMTLHIDRDFEEKLVAVERETRMSQRMQILARSLMVVVAGLFAIAGYVRLDEWSKGYYSGLLKAIAVIAVVGIGFAAWMK